MKKTLAVLMALALCACAAKPTIESDPVAAVAQSPHTFAACRAVDAATTLHIIGHGGKELNPFMQPLVAVPVLFIAAQIIIVALIYTQEERMTPEAKVTANAIGCVPAATNVAQLVKGGL